MMRLFPVVQFAILILVGCAEALEYSPNQVHDSDSPRDLNARNLDKLSSSERGDTITIVFTGDSQQFYDEVELFVEKVNAIEAVDFVLIAGDISDFGLLEEFEWIVARLDKLNRPYFGVIGNHDVVANGEAVFKRMFGPLNYSFVFNNVKFILHNTNGREYLAQNVPDLTWLRNELQAGPHVENFIAVSHVPPFHGDFNANLESEYTSLFSSTPGFLASLHGHVHKHTDGYPYDDEVRYITSNSFESREFVILKIASGKVSAQVVYF